LFGGDFTSVNSRTSNRIAEMISDVTVLQNYGNINIGTGFNAPVRHIVLQNDNKILVGGAFSSYAGTVMNNLVRLERSGLIDSSFNAGSNLNDTVNNIACQSDGKIIIVGDFVVYGNVFVNGICRLHSNGTLDTSFNDTLSRGFNGSVKAVALQSDGKIIVAGYFSVFNGNINKPYIIRLNTDGSADNSFNTSVSPIYTTDEGFNCLAIQSDGKILAAGYYPIADLNTGTGHIIRLNSDGSYDSSFAIGTGFNNIVRCIHLQNDGQILLGGDFTNYNNTNINRLIRLNTNGTIDTTFTVPGTGFNNAVFAIASQLNGKIVVGGSFTTYNGLQARRLFRLNQDGTSDNSLVTNVGSTVHTININ
jgi:uncharacterized delta-60 repeat protein